MSTELMKSEAVEVGYNLGSLAVSKPGDVITVATSVATPLAKLIDEKKLFKIISGKKFVYVEGWSTMGAMLGVVPRHVPELSKRKDDGEYEEAVELVRVSDGMVVGRAAHICGGETDRVWKPRAEYARKSMAVTRATGKAFRLAFSWIMTLAGYAATPAEEMDEAEAEQHKPAGKTAGNGHAPVDQAEKAFRDRVSNYWNWFKSFKAEQRFLDILGSAGYEKASEIPKDKRESFFKALDDAKTFVQEEQVKKAEAAKTETEPIDEPVSEQVEAEFEEAGI